MGEVIEALLLDKAQTAALTGINVKSVHRLLIRGVLTPIRPGGMRMVRVERAEVLAWIAAGCPDRKGWREGKVAGRRK